MCSCNAHMFYKEVQEALNIPVIHIGDPLSKILKENFDGKNVALIGSSYLTQKAFFR